MTHRIANLAELRNPEGWAAVRRDLGLMVKAGRLHEAREYLDRPLAERPEWTTRADTDEDLAPLR